jgi:hypothetical protein
MLTFATDPDPLFATFVDAALEHAYGLFLLHPAPTLADLERLSRHGIAPRPGFAAWVHYGERLRACFPGDAACRSVRALQEAVAAPERYRPADYLWALLYETLRLFYVEHCSGWEAGLLDPDQVDPIRQLHLGDLADQYLPDQEILRAYLSPHPIPAGRPSLYRLQRKEPALPCDLALTLETDAAPEHTETRDPHAPEILLHLNGTLGTFNASPGPTPVPLLQHPSTNHGRTHPAPLDEQEA